MAEVEREAMEYDVVIVGCGPCRAVRRDPSEATGRRLQCGRAGKRLRSGRAYSSGAVLDPVGLDALIPDWKEKGAPIKTKGREDNFYMLGEAGKIRVPNFPMPPLMHNHGNYIVSMGNVCRWMAEAG